MSSDSEVSVATPVVRTVDRINWRDIVDLVEGDVIGLRVPDFYPVALCDRFTDPIVNQTVQSYTMDSDINRIGKAIAEAAADPAQLEEYYRTAPEALRRLRQLFHPYLAPMDKLRLVLQEQWPAGSHIESLHGLPMFCGLIRTYREGAEARPHQDMIHWNAPQSWPAKSMTTQISANIHVTTAELGGELELWPYGISDSKRYQELQVPDDYALDRLKIGPSMAKIKPRKGDLILIDARRIHAVNRVEQGIRVAVSAFLGYRGPAQPLTLYS
jgi:hypothetical protein